MALARIVRAGIALAAIACGLSSGREAAGADSAADLGPLLKRMCEDGAVAPGGVAVVVRDGRVRSIGAFGRRVAGAEGALRLDDPIPLGALAAPTTALVCALAVESGSVRWTTTLGDVLGDVAPAIDVGWRTATLTELASRRIASVEGITLPRIVETAGGAGAPAQKCRDALLHLVGSVAPKTPHGTFDPVNRSGPCLAALLAERDRKSVV